jgi:hypothetical protein
LFRFLRRRNISQHAGTATKRPPSYIEEDKMTCRQVIGARKQSRIRSTALQRAKKHDGVT